MVTSWGSDPGLGPSFPLSLSLGGFEPQYPCLGNEDSREWPSAGWAPGPGDGPRMPALVLGVTPSLLGEPRGLGALPGAFLVGQPLLRRPWPRGWRLPPRGDRLGERLRTRGPLVSRGWRAAHLAPRLRLRPPRVVRTAPIFAGRCAPGRTAGTRAAGRAHGLLSPSRASREAASGKMVPSSPRALFLLLLLLACPESRASQVSVPAAASARSPSRGSTPRLECATWMPVGFSVPLGFSFWRKTKGVPLSLPLRLGPGAPGGPGLVSLRQSRSARCVGRALRARIAGNDFPGFLTLGAFSVSGELPATAGD